MCFSSGLDQQAKGFLKLSLNRAMLERAQSSLAKLAAKITASLGTGYQKLSNELHFLLMLIACLLGKPVLGPADSSSFSSSLTCTALAWSQSCHCIWCSALDPPHLWTSPLVFSGRWSPAFQRLFSVFSSEELQNTVSHCATRVCSTEGQHLRESKDSGFACFCFLAEETICRF